MEGSTPSTFFHLLLFVLLLTGSTGAKQRTYIVHVERNENSKLANSVDDTETWYRSFLPKTVTSSPSADGDNARMIHMYNHVLSGFAARLTEDEVREMSRKGGFIQAYPSRTYALQTTHTPAFLGLNLPNGLWSQSDSGKGVIVGVIDTGVAKDHPSFHDQGMPPPPSKWKGRCESNFTFLCNNKLIGARAFLDASNAANGGNLTISPLDDFGHGTHTASTAAGAAVPDAQFLGNAKGMASGMAPRAHLATYRVCANGCKGADILAAMDAAIFDGADVLSLSLAGESMPFYEDVIAIGSFRAIQKGVFVSCAAANGGPNASTLSNEAPWILTVAASITDRSIRATVTLGNGLEFNGQSAFQPQDYVPTPYPLVYAGASGNPDAAFCGNGSLNGFDVKGKIVLCEVGGQAFRFEKGVTVKNAGGIGMILMNQIEEGIITRADAHVLPASHVSYLDGLKVKEYINSTATPTAKISFEGTVFDGKTPSPAIAYFSSRGPSLASPGILKPDITGPGVDIIAAWPFSANPGSTGVNFNVISGTSMSTPHLSGVAALIKSVHPDWSPAAIKSAIMTTAEIYDRKGNRIVDERNQPADLFAMGAGHVNPNRASDPGLVYDISPSDYIPYLCGLGYNNTQVKMIVGQSIDCSSVEKITEGELNYPSISVLFASGATSVSLERTVKNVGEANSKYWAEIDAPADVSVTVEPKMLQFSKANEEIKFTATFAGSESSGHGRVSRGYLKWVSKDRTVRSPISVTFN